MWVHINTELPPENTLVLVRVLVEDESYPEPIFVPDLGSVDMVGRWTSNYGRPIRVVWWTYLPPMETLEDTSDFARRGVNAHKV